MRASDECKTFIKSFESLSLKAYHGQADKPNVFTIGWGHTHGVKLGQVITKAQAEVLFNGDLLSVEQYLNKYYPNLTQGQFDALCSFIFNLGVGNFEKGTLDDLIKRKAPMSEIQAKFDGYIYSNGKKQPGLVKRRAWEAERWVS